MLKRLLLTLLLANAKLYAQMIDEIVFENQSFYDIFVSLSKIAEVSIIADNTVQGKASYYFTHSDFSSAFASFLQNYNLFYTLHNNIYTVSRIYTQYDKGLLTMKAVDIDAALLIRKVATITGQTILADSYPRTVVNINAENLPIKDVLEILVRQSNLKVEVNDSYYYLIAESEHFSNSVFRERSSLKKSSSSALYTANLENGRLSDLVYELFQHEQKEYALMFRGDSPISNFRFADKPFDQMLSLLLFYGNADYLVLDDIYYIFELQRSDMTKKLRPTRTLTLQNIDATYLLDLLPSHLNQATLFKVDKRSNTIFLTGSPQETQSIEAFIALVDTADHYRHYYQVDINYLAFDHLLPLLAEQGIEKALPIPGTRTIALLATQTEYQRIKRFIDTIDVEKLNIPIQLKYIRAEDFINNLPPNISKDNLSLSSNPNIFYFTGSIEAQKQLLNELQTIDQPATQIKYDLLVVQYQKSNNATWNKNLNLINAPKESSSSVLGTLGSLLNFKFDVIANLGLQFALNFDIAVKEKEAFVLADTQLNALSGHEAKFQNTTTSRYSQSEINPETGRPLYSSVKEITSGLILTVKGWVSGDGMITVDVSTTVSRQGGSSSDTKNPPSTYEKVLTTEVRTPSGKPLIIGGLIQQDDEQDLDRLPWISKVPLLGRLFRNKTTTKEHTEFVIYLVPHVQKAPADHRLQEKELEELYAFAQTLL